ncbi:hypothetical protein [Burkholderia gladioli]|uniref:hypothetical protein n=1 Tax=Burkholderia gladioli TaxID=28095 RepID=UPI00164008C3|nr:hypothetical protein [Burkholderia gladioli]
MHFDDLDPLDRVRAVFDAAPVKFSDLSIDGAAAEAVRGRVSDVLRVRFPNLSRDTVANAIAFAEQACSCWNGPGHVDCLDNFLARKGPLSAVELIAYELYYGIWAELVVGPLFDAYARLRKSSDARDRAEQRHQSSPQAAAKAEVKSCWDDWQKGRKRYKSNAEFARDMVKKHEGVLTSTKVIEGWCTDWGRKKSSIHPA